MCHAERPGILIDDNGNKNGVDNAYQQVSDDRAKNNLRVDFPGRGDLFQKQVHDHNEKQDVGAFGNHQHYVKPKDAGDPFSQNGQSQKRKQKGGLFIERQYSGNKDEGIDCSEKGSVPCSGKDGEYECGKKDGYK